MKTYTHLTFVLLVLSFLPMTTLAYSSNEDLLIDNKRVNLEEGYTAGFGANIFTSSYIISGIANSIGTDTFTMTTDTGRVFIVSTVGPHIYILGEPDETTAVQVNDSVRVYGKVVGNTVTAEEVVLALPGMYANPLNGSVVVVDEHDDTVQTENSEPVSSVMTGTNSYRFFEQNQTPTSAPQAGVHVVLGGLWNEIVNTFAVIKVRIF
jgi:hypothetical protein